LPRGLSGPVQRSETMQQPAAPLPGTHHVGSGSG
jgi:hypothetical protein